jgi:hypothetical protein
MAQLAVLPDKSLHFPQSWKKRPPFVAWFCLHAMTRRDATPRASSRTNAMTRPTPDTQVARRPIRNRKFVDMGDLIRRFLADGPDAIQTNRTVARHMFGAEDNQLNESDIRKARSMIEQMIKCGLPLCPCYEDGTLQETKQAYREACRGLQRRYRFDPHGSILGEALREAMGDTAAKELAIGAIALGSAVVNVCYEEAGVLLDAVWRSIPPKAFAEAEKEFAVRRKAAGGLGQTSRRSVQ